MTLTRFLWAILGLMVLACVGRSAYLHGFRAGYEARREAQRLIDELEKLKMRPWDEARPPPREGEVPA